MITCPRTNEPSIMAHAPCRVDLAGGTMDIWPLYLFHPGAVTVNFAVSVLTSCRIVPLGGRVIRFRSLDTEKEEEFRDLAALVSARRYQHPLAAYLTRFFAPQHGFLMETHSESPAGAGISGSSALMIASTAALARFTGRSLDPEQIRVIAQNVEAQLIRVPTGCQDYYPALFGGVSAIHQQPDGIHHETIRLDPEELDRRFVLAYTGAPRQSGINNWKVFQAHIGGDAKVIRNFDCIGEIARAMHAALKRADWPEIARLLRDEWKLRKTNAPRITTSRIEELISIAKRKGAMAAKVCGAGGGGCIVLLCEPESKEQVASAITERGGQVLAARVARAGLTLSGEPASS